MSAFKSILVHLDSSARCAERLQVARQVAQKFDSALVAHYCVTPSLWRYPLAIEYGGDILGIMEEVDAERRAKAYALYSKHSNGGAGIAWSEQTIDAPWGLVTRALYSDLLVLGQRDPDDPAVADMPADFLPSLLVDSGRPGLLLPFAGPVAPIGNIVLVAWKETREAARAVRAALPWLYSAKEVHVIGYGDDPQGPLEALHAYLNDHGVAASIHPSGVETGDAAQALLSRAADLEADLLVMGCYGHSRARERVLGGMTRSILDSMTLPVLMVH